MPPGARYPGGMSRGSVTSHRRFAEKLSLPLSLLSDPERQAIAACGVWQEKKYGWVSMGIVRSAFVIDEQGRVIWAKAGVKPDTRAAQSLARLYSAP